MHKNWIELCAAFNLGIAEAYDNWLMLESLHDTLGRYYHTLAHPIEMADALPDLVDYAQDYNAVGWAVWFHDCIYNSKRKDNEQLSIHMMRLMLGGRINRETLDAVEGLIAVTVHHKPAKGTDEELIVDLDLMRFAAPWELFVQNNEDIRKEYLWVPEDVYSEKRIEVLEHFGAMNPMFHTPLFHERYETAAHENIERLIANVKY